MTKKTFDGDRNDWVRIEEYADSVISGILETAIGLLEETIGENK